MAGHSSIHFIQNLMLNSNLFEIWYPKNIKVKRLKTKKGQTEFDRVSTLIILLYFILYVYMSRASLK
jgi:hypothetical protein